MAYGIYLHIPYCASRCRYCDFYSLPAHTDVPEAYINALIRYLRLHGLKNPAPDTVYFGGGTPGLLRPAQIERILKQVQPKPTAEITLEINPASYLPPRMEGWRQAGINRLSIGVQSARDASLRLLGRTHTARQAAEAFSSARKAGFHNLTGDIMLALPDYTKEELDETLALLVQGGATHISAYLLKIEENTPWGKKPPGNMPGPDTAAEFYLYAAARLQQEGFARYEISNFARPGCESQHNLLYWECEDYLGLGPSAHSCLAGRRFSFESDVNAFINDDLPLKPEGGLTAEDYVMLQLRLETGLRQTPLNKRFNYTLSKTQTQFFARLVQAGFARVIPDGWALTSQGLLVQNMILKQLL